MTVGTNRFLEIVRREIRSRLDPLLKEPEEYRTGIVRENGLLVLMIYFRDFSYRFCVDRTYRGLVGKWLDIMERIHGAKSVEEVEIMLEASGR